MDIKIINDAINAHGLWKDRLKVAIETGVSDFSPEKVATDNNCDFGKWLHGLSSEETQTPICQKVLRLHAEFHKAASAVLQLALDGKKEEAGKMVTEVGSAYLYASSKLVLALSEWKRSIPS